MGNINKNMRVQVRVGLALRPLFGIFELSFKLIFLLQKNNNNN